MLTIRFQRAGRKNDPAFRIVLTEKRSKPKSGEIEILGAFYPKTKETRLKSERILYWLSKGAKASARVHNILITKRVISGKKINVAKNIAVSPSIKETPAEETPVVQVAPDEAVAVDTAAANS